MRRGDVYRARLVDHGGREQHGWRYVVVVQADPLLGLSTVIVVPTSRSRRETGFRPKVEIDGAPTRVLIENLQAVDFSRLHKFVGRLTAHELVDVDRALRLVLALR